MLRREARAVLIATPGADCAGRDVVGAPAVLVLHDGECIAATVAGVVTKTIGVVDAECWYDISALIDAGIDGRGPEHTNRVARSGILARTVLLRQRVSLTVT